MSNAVYPTLPEILRAILVSMDIKNYQGNESAKEIDNLVAKSVYDPREFDEIFNNSLGSVLCELLGQEKSQTLIDYINHFLMDYIKIVRFYSLEGLTRQEIIPILIKGIGRKHILNLLSDMCQLVKGPTLQELSQAQTSFVPTVLSWFKKYDEDAWQEFYNQLNESGKDRIRAWQSEGNLPTVQQLKLLKQQSNKFVSDLVIWLWIARSLDALMRDNEIESIYAYKLINTSNEDVFKYTETAINDHKVRIAKKIPVFNHELLSECFAYLAPNCPKYKGDNGAIKDNIKYLNSFYQRKNIANWDHLFDFYLARWHVYNGELDQALILYKQSFENGLFCSGKNLEILIREALVVATSVKNIDHVFIKQLKWADILFKYDIPSVFNQKPSNKKEDNIEAWEIEMWQKNFETVFPKQGWFKDSKLIQCDIKDDVTPKSSKLLKPDYKKPDKKVIRQQNTERPDGTVLSYGSITRKEPQLIYYMIFNEYDVAEKLIECGASVNVKSEVGDTPILIALKALDKTRTILDSFITNSKPSGDERLFQLISSVPHDADIINQVTQKRRLLPIIAAVETGRIDIVKKIIELGADVNRRGTLDNVTALYRCIQLMGDITRKEKSQKAHEYSRKYNRTAGFAAARRMSGGELGHRINDYAQHEHFSESLSEVFSELFSIELDGYSEVFSYVELLKIAKLLINNGAKMDARHKIMDLEDYTPLAFAAENDLDDLFRYMLLKNGDPKVKCKYTEQGMTKFADCWDVATHWKSEKVLAVLQKLS